MMRGVDDAPPVARGGAPTSRLGGSVPNRDALCDYVVVRQPEPEETNWWIWTSRTLTCCVWPVCLTWWGKRDPTVQQAWREKLALCLIILFIMFWVAFLTFGLQPTICGKSTSTESNTFFNQTDHTIPYRDDVMINGFVFDFNEVGSRLKERGNISMTADFYNTDITSLFQPTNDACAAFGKPAARNCSVSNRIPTSPPLAPTTGQPCPTLDWLDGIKPKYRLFFFWDEIAQHTDPPHQLFVYNGAVLNLTAYWSGNGSTDYLKDTLAAQRLVPNLGKDATLALSSNPESVAAGRCLHQRHLVGYIDNQSVGCAANQIITTIVLTVIMGVVLVRFVMALAFHWIVSARLTTVSAFTPAHRRYVSQAPSQWRGPTMAYSGPDATSIGMQPLGSVSLSRFWKEDGQMYAILLVTCYSEGEKGIRKTLNSLAATTYDDDHKLLFVIADGIIKGAGNDKTTPEIIVDMMEVVDTSEPKEYIAIADGSKQCNRAKVYSGYYIHGSHRVPMVTIVKCGAESETGAKKPGNRGKRDSQLILMNFLSRVMFNHRMTPLDYTLFNSIRHITDGISAGAYEVVLMVDADTCVAEDSLDHMINAMASDDKIMGLCGETRIANKTTSWVCMIQVFEYYISHHLGKAFESMFGGVTCLPGCFCMYRIKVRKGLDHMVPVLVNPDILDEYCENVVDTLHKKNLLLLGEDRFLTTLMLRSFPKRKMVFVPQALCHTDVPDEFKVLLSQRRRWINSTIHNLLELVKLRDLCGIFCFSMQFVIALELIGTVVLPAAITFVLVLILSAIFTGTAQTVPLLMLAATLGLPGVLIIITTRKMVYVGWMFVYLLALPIWNFVLPVYAFWHFDDFTWGETRKVEGEGGQKDHSGRDGRFDPASVPLKEWAEWEALSRLNAPLARQHRRSLPEIPVNVANSSAMPATNNQPFIYGGNKIVDTYAGTMRTSWAGAPAIDPHAAGTMRSTWAAAPSAENQQSAYPPQQQHDYGTEELYLPGSWRGPSNYHTYAHNTVHAGYYHSYQPTSTDHHGYAYDQQATTIPNIAVQPPTPATEQVRMTEVDPYAHYATAPTSALQGVSAAVAKYWGSVTGSQASNTYNSAAPAEPTSNNDLHPSTTSHESNTWRENNAPQITIHAGRTNAAELLPPLVPKASKESFRKEDNSYGQDMSFLSASSFSFASTVESIPGGLPSVAAPQTFARGDGRRQPEVEGSASDNPGGTADAGRRDVGGPSNTRGGSSRPPWR
ncbi:hypothetical protein HDV00_008467 [Rhizophlyctis rosea]|nr:hypothetical protein HDV00_008467 [Rhizophlyctis rosea]